MKETVETDNWSNGKIRSKIHFLNGSAHGLNEGWYKNGNKYYKIYYFKGREQGLFAVYIYNHKTINHKTIDHQRTYRIGSRHGLEVNFKY